MYEKTRLSIFVKSWVLRHNSKHRIAENQYYRIKDNINSFITSKRDTMDNTILFIFFNMLTIVYWFLIIIIRILHKHF